MTTSPDDLVGRALHAADGRQVGRIGAVYQYPDDVHAPAGAVEIGGGLLRRAHLVDLQDATLAEDTVTVPHDRQTINSAPHFIPLVGDTLSERDAVKVRAHYWGAAQPA